MQPYARTVLLQHRLLILKANYYYYTTTRFVLPARLLALAEVVSLEKTKLPAFAYFGEGASSG